MSHCVACGSRHESDTYPKSCGCGVLAYFNPVPVAVMLYPVQDEYDLGLILIRRGIEPFKGEWAFPGGFVEGTDLSIEHAACREFKEETGVEAEPRLIHIESTANTNTGRMLIFCRYQTTSLQKFVNNFQPSEEAPEYRIATRPEKLCFPLHTDAMADWFHQYKRR